MSITGRIHSVETCGTTDGPGIRYILFTQGCLMRCKYCHNRDTWATKGGYELSVEDVMKDVRRYRRFFKSSGGGITASGGEASLQPAFIGALFEAARKEGIHTCLDTNGYIKRYTSEIKAMIDATDLMLLDIKQMNDEKHIALTKVTNRYTLKLAQYLADINKPAWIRYVVVAGWTDADEDIRALGEFLQPMQNIEKVELLPFHQLGSHKWEVFRDNYEFKELKPPSKESLDHIVAVLGEYGVTATY